MGKPTGIDSVGIRDAGTSDNFDDLGRIVGENTDGLDPEMFEDSSDTHQTPINAGQAMQPTIAFDRATTSYTLSQLTTDMDDDTKKEIEITYVSGKTLRIEGYLFGVMPINDPSVGPAEQGQFSIREIAASGGFIPS